MNAGQPAHTADQNTADNSADAGSAAPAAPTNTLPGAPAATGARTQGQVSNSTPAVPEDADSSTPVEGGLFYDPLSLGRPRPV
ncbi:MAG: hypothetical protein OXC07_01230 [Kistimonas sp.]|nr:hypothetical protein [Kistimonas sp.]